MARNKKRQRRERDEEDRCDDPLELKLYRDPWTVKKKLTESDVNDLCRLILPRDEVEKHVLPFFNPEERHAVLWSERGLLVKVKDLTDDHGNCYHLTFKRWTANRSYKLGLNWISKFVNRRALKKDDVIGMFWDNYNGCFCFSVIERSPLPLAAADAADAAEPVAAAIPPRPDPCLCEFARKHLRLSPPMPQP